MLRRGFAQIVLVLGVVVVAASGQSSPRFEGFQVAAGGSHLWFIKRSKIGDHAPTLYHHADSTGGPYFRPFIDLSGWPDRFVAWGPHAWMLYAQTNPSGRDVLREVYSIDATFNDTTQSYQPAPIDHLKKEQSLPSLGRLVDLIATPRGPVALLIPSQRAEATVQGRPNSQSAQPVLEGPRLLRLEGMQWADIELPPEAEISPGSRITCYGGRGAGLAIISPPADPDLPAHAYISQADGSWESSPFDLGPGELLQALPVAAQVTIVQQDGAKHAWLVSYVRETGLIPMAKLPEPGRLRAVVSLDDRLYQFQLKSDGVVSAQSMDGLTGTLSTWQDYSLQPIPPHAMWQTVIITGLVLVVIFLAVTIRPEAAVPVQLPPKTAACPFGLRLTALLLDLVPGAILAVLVLKCRVVDLLHHPLLGGSPEDMLPFCFMVLVAMAHSLPAELLRSTTLGKALVGARVVSIDGTKPTARQVLTRNLYKLLLLIVPPLAVLMIRSPNLRGVPEIKSRTVVIHEIDEPAPS